MENTDTFFGIFSLCMEDVEIFDPDPSQTICTFKLVAVGIENYYMSGGNITMVHDIGYDIN